MTSKDTNPKDAIGTKKWRQFMVVPRQVLWEVGVGMLEGALKYGRHNYRGAGVRASVYCDAALGHIEQFIEGEDIDQDSGLSHVTKAICSLVVLRDAMMNDFWTDDRPPKIANLDALRDRLQKKVEENFERWADKAPHHYTEVEDGSPYRVARTRDEMAYPEVFNDGPIMPGREAVWMTPDEIAVVDAMLKSGEMGKRIEVAKMVPRDMWNASAVDVQNDEILATASTAWPLDDPKWLPREPMDVLGEWEPTKWVKDHPDNQSYDREHVLDAITQAQLDRLVRKEAVLAGVVVSEAPSDVELWNAVARRVLLRLLTRRPAWFTIDFPMGGTGRRYSRLRSDDWFIAIPGCRVTPDPAPRSFA